MIKNFYLILILFLTDRISKESMERILILNKPYPLNSFFSFHLLHNYYASFGIEIPFSILIFLSIIAVLILSFYILRERRFFLSLSLILAGVLGNLYDRIFYGYVIDFISIGKFPVFNLADSFISLGGFFLILNLIKDKGG